MNDHTFSRRFNRRTMLASSVAGIFAGSRAFGQDASRASLGDGYVDIHIHLAQPWYGPERGPLSTRDILNWMDAHDVAVAAILPLVSPEAFWYPITTDYVLRETAPHRDRLIPFCAIDPRTLGTHLPEQQQVVDMLRRYQDAGARGFGEHKPLLEIDHDLNLRLYEACSNVGLPVLFHLDNRANMDRPGLPGLEGALRRFPDLVMIGHGKGWWASIAGGLKQDDLHVGYPRGPVAPGGAVDRLMNDYKNLYGDLSSSGAHAMLRDPEFGQQFLIRRADQLLFGTDYYDRTQKEFAQFELFDKFELPAEVKAKIARQNAAQLLK